MEIYFQLGVSILLLFAVGFLIYDRFIRQTEMRAPPVQAPRTTELISDKFVLLVIAVGLILIILAIIQVIYLSATTDKVLPNWAENVFVAISTAAILKLGDCLNALVALVTGRQVAQLGNKLGDSQPLERPNPEAPAGTEADPLHVAGAASGERPVRTTTGKASK